MTVGTPWGDLLLRADDWAEAFDAPGPGTPHNEAREAIWDALLEILTSQNDDENVPADRLRRSLRQHRDLRDAVGRAWPLIEPTDLVGDLWSVPAYLRKCAPWLSPGRCTGAARGRPRLDGGRPAAAGRGPAAARRPAGVRRQRQQAAEVAAQRQQMARVVENLIEAGGDDEYGTGLATMLRGEDFRTP
jgi:hypothetical protein